MPVGRFVAEFDISDIIVDEPERLWMRTRGGAGISKDYFDAYFVDRDKAFALSIGEVRCFEQPINPVDVMENFTPPQSYMYIGNKFERVNRAQNQLEMVV
ncbi:hypothetical protein K32_13070 [Kaistia sp. 32K]|nr:hypothetical protein K32_13070 [Kaistia sp. 32K]